eukprot:g14063.t2
MKGAGLAVNNEVCGAAIGSCMVPFDRGERGEPWREALSFFEILKAEQKPNGVTYIALLSAFAGCSRWEEALQLVEQQTDIDERQAEHVKITNSAITACGRAIAWPQALHVFQETSRPTLVTYNALLYAFAEASEWSLALQVLHELNQKIVPNVVTLNSVLHALCTGSHHVAAQRLLGRMPDYGLTADLYSYTTVMSACTSVSCWEMTCDLLTTMMSKQIDPDMHSVNNVISALASGPKWQEAFHMFSNIDQFRLAPDHVTHSTLIAQRMRAAVEEAQRAQLVTGVVPQRPSPKVRRSSSTRAVRSRRSLQRRPSLQPQGFRRPRQRRRPVGPGGADGGNVSLDSEVSEDEARDGLGELKAFEKPSAIDQSISIMFFVDLSRSMSRTDFTGRPELRRIDAVVTVLKRFIAQQQSMGAAMDLYSLVTFATSKHEVRFHRLRASEAIAKLGSIDFTPDGAMVYDKIVRCIRELAVPGQVCRVIFLSDGCPTGLQRHVLPSFQAVAAENPHVILHCIGFGNCDFSILQQLAQIGRGSFNCADMDIDSLVNTFTTVSKTITETRSTVHRRERHTRQVAFDSAKRFSGNNDNIKEKKAKAGMRTTLVLRGGQLMKSRSKKCIVYLHDNPFMQGGMRLVHRFRDQDLPTKMVAKFSRYVGDDNSWDFIKGFAQSTIQTRKFSQKFHEAVLWRCWADSGDDWEPPRMVKCTQSFVYEVQGMLFTGEAFLEGSQRGFLKWINNRGEILIPEGSSNYSMVPEAFAHFSLDDSGGQMMVADLQGVLLGSKRVHLTDPQILSLDQSFGAADLGSAAMQRFRSMHVCNKLCRKLGLSSLSSIPQRPRTRSALNNVRAAPTLPATPPPSVPAAPQPERGRTQSRSTVVTSSAGRSEEEFLKLAKEISEQF